MQNNPLIFISYSSDDQKIAFALCEYLEKNSLRCWIAPRNNAAGIDYAVSIIEGINLSRIMIVLLSETSNNSVSVKNEVQIAAKKNLKLLPFFINDINISKPLEFFLSSIHWLNGFEKKAENYFPEVYKTCLELLKEDLTKPILKPQKIVKVNTTETFVWKNNLTLVLSIILSVSVIVIYFVLNDKNEIKREPSSNSVDAISDSVENNSKNSTVFKTNLGVSKKAQEEPTIAPSRSKSKEDAMIEKPDLSAELEGNDLDNVKFINPKNNDFINFYKNKNGKYSFNGSASKISFSGMAIFDGNSCFKIIPNETIKGSIYINENHLRGDFVLLKENFTPIDFVLFKD